MFRPGELWRHKNCLDIDVEIKKVGYMCSEYFKIRVKYWNRHIGVYCWNDPETVKIKREDFYKWKLIK